MSRSTLLAGLMALLLPAAVSGEFQELRQSVFGMD